MLDGFRSRCITEPAVREGHRLRHLQQQRSRDLDVQCPLAAIDIDRLALDVLEREERPPLRIGAGVVQPRDVRVLERGQDVALTRHALG